MLSSTDLQKLNLINQTLNEAYAHRLNQRANFNKSAEARIQLSFKPLPQSMPNSIAGGKIDLSNHLPELDVIGIYSYDLGPYREHFFNSLDDALTTVQFWHDRELGTTYNQFGDLIAEPEMTDPNLYLNH